jgi:hypothetical protein
MFESELWRWQLDLRGRKQHEGGEYYIMRRYTIWICTPGKILLGWSIKENEMGTTCGTYGVEMARTEIHTGICWGNLKERGHLENRRLGGSIIMTWLNKQDGMVCIGFLWLRRGPSGGICSVPWNAWKSVSQEGLCSMTCFVYFLHQIWKEHTRIHAQANMSCVSKMCNC